MGWLQNLGFRFGQQRNQLLFDIGGIGLDIFIEHAAMLALEGFAFTAKTPMTGVFQRVLPLLNIARLYLV